MGQIIDNIRFYANHAQVTYPECEIEIHISPRIRDLILKEIEDSPLAVKMSPKEIERWKESVSSMGLIAGHCVYVVMGLDIEGYRIVPKLRGK